MKIVYAYVFKPSKNCSRMVRHLRPTAGILCYTTDKNDYTEERNAMATIQPYFIPMSKKGNLQWYKARKIDNVFTMSTMLDAIAMYNLDVKKYIKKLQENINFMSSLIIDGGK